MTHPDRPPFQDPDLPADLRTADLLDRLTTKERIGLLHQYQAPIPRLGVQPFRTGTEALHGLAWLGRATVFPQVVGLAATWDTDLVRRVGEAVAEEVQIGRAACREREARGEDGAVVKKNDDERAER